MSRLFEDRETSLRYEAGDLTTPHLQYSCIIANIQVMLVYDAITHLRFSVCWVFSCCLVIHVYIPHSVCSYIPHGCFPRSSPSVRSVVLVHQVMLGSRVVNKPTLEISLAGWQSLLVALEHRVRIFKLPSPSVLSSWELRTFLQSRTYQGPRHLSLVGKIEGQDSKVCVLDFSALPLRSGHVVFVGARYKHVRCTNSKLRVLYTRDRPTK